MKAKPSSYILLSKPALEHVRVTYAATDAVGIPFVVSQVREQGQVILWWTTTSDLAWAFGETVCRPIVAHRCHLQPVVFGYVMV
jgi:hypothetical protein